VSFARTGSGSLEGRPCSSDRLKTMATGTRPPESPRPPDVDVASQPRRNSRGHGGWPEGREEPVARAGGVEDRPVWNYAARRAPVARRPSVACILVERQVSASAPRRDFATGCAGPWEFHWFPCPSHVAGRCHRRLRRGRAGGRPMGSSCARVPFRSIADTAWPRTDRAAASRRAAATGRGSRSAPHRRLGARATVRRGRLTVTLYGL